MLQIAMAWENLGEYQLAFNAAEMIPAEEGKDMVWDRGEAFFELAKAQIREGNARAALGLVSQAVPVDDWPDALRVGIARLQARAGDLDGAQATVKQIINRSRHVEGMLNIATELAKSGKITEARKTIENAPKLVMRFPTLREGGPSFDYNRPETWAVEYEFDGFLDNCMVHYLDMLAGDLAAAAMRFQMALPDAETCEYARAFKDLKHESSKLRKIAAAQAEAGHARAALKWIVEFDSIVNIPDGAPTDKGVQDLASQNLARDSKVKARLGILEGVLQRVKGGKRPSLDDWYEHW
jgi:hypothetical protein